jgi:AcrR family transcriptional regulator
MSMAPKSKPSKRDAILDAMLDIVVERGFHDAPMSLISQRSGASAGIIYHYFSSKEEIIKALYERIRALKVEAFLADFDPDQEPGLVFVQIFISVYNFYRKHQREMRFYELCEHAGFACTEHVANDARAVAFAKRFSSQSRGGILKEWPTDVLEEMTLGVVTRLASQRKRLSVSLLQEIAEGIWELVKA